MLTVRKAGEYKLGGSTPSDAFYRRPPAYGVFLSRAQQQEYGVSEISRILNLNKSTVHNILNSLAHHKVLIQNDGTRRYQLAPALAELGSLPRVVEAGLEISEKLGVSGL